jgi:uncharacterized membrane protein
MSTDSDRSTSRDDDLPGVERLLTLSDGVVAIALTLLVLQLRVPTVDHVLHPDSASDLASALGKDTDQLTSYGISFYVIAQFWLVHHRVFRQISGQREGLAWWNFAFLFTITVMPFTSDLLGQFGSNPLAVDIFAFNLLLATLATQATIIFGRRNHLMAAGISQRDARAGQLRSVGSALVVGASIGVAWVDTNTAKYLWLLLAVVPRLADRLAARPRPSDAAGPGG